MKVLHHPVKPASPRYWPVKRLVVSSENALLGYHQMDNSILALPQSYSVNNHAYAAMVAEDAKNAIIRGVILTSYGRTEPPAPG